MFLHFIDMVFVPAGVPTIKPTAVVNVPTSPPTSVTNSSQISESKYSMVTEYS